MLDVFVLTPQEVIFEGKAKSLVAPGESGVFEILSYHKRLLTRLISGIMFIDEKSLRIRRGLLKVNKNKVTVIIER